MNPELKQRLTAGDTWTRGLFIVIFALIYSITDILLTAVVVFQFLATLFTGETNARLRAFGLSLAAYIYQIIAFMTFNSDEKPFPFSVWPEGRALGRGPEEGEVR
jgi:Domain of unknown function (DUF4389)